MPKALKKFNIQNRNKQRKEGNTFVLLIAARVNCLQSTEEASVIIYPACGLPLSLPTPTHRIKELPKTQSERTTCGRERLVFIGDCNNICCRRRRCKRGSPLTPGVSPRARVCGMEDGIIRTLPCSSVRPSSSVCSENGRADVMWRRSLHRYAPFGKKRTVPPP